MIIVTGSVQMAPDTRDMAIKLGCAHSQRSRDEAGCLAHHCMVDAEDTNRLVFHEEWADIAALQAHFAVPESGRFVREMSELAVTPPAISLFNASAIDAAPF